MPELPPAEIAAVKVLIAHQRRDIGSCICGWGVDTGDLGRLHSLHVWRELQRAVLHDHAARVRAETAEGIAQAIEAMDLDLGKPLTRSGAAAIARAHRTTPGDDHA